MGLVSAVADVLATFRTVNVNGSPLRAFDDSGQVNPPCVWVPVPSVVFQFGKRVLEVEWQAYLVAANSSLVSVSSTMSEMVDAVTGLYPFRTGTPYPLSLPGGGQPVPSYQLTWSARIAIGE
jgi:hypothetical protein